MTMSGSPPGVVGGWLGWDPGLGLERCPWVVMAIGREARLARRQAAVGAAALAISEDDRLAGAGAAATVRVGAQGQRRRLLPQAGGGVEVDGFLPRFP